MDNRGDSASASHLYASHSPFLLDQGDGKFWESDESRPEDTTIKITELRRNRDESEALTMRKESHRDKQALVRKRLAN
jgi:hypothetical protein